jgi:4-carboxymuconolactone decarboxylase
MERKREIVRPIDNTYEALNDEQAAVFNEIATGPRGAVEGPLLVLVLNPELADHVQKLGAYCRYKISLTPRIRELAIIVIGAFWQAGFEWEAHAPLAQEAGIDPTVIEAIRLRAEPSFTKPDEQAVYDALRALLIDRDVPDEAYSRLICEIGRQGAIDLIGIAGYYCLICLTINAFRVPLVLPLADPFQSN